MGHKIEISDKTYEALKGYCTWNNLKIGQYADKLLFDQLMIEIYGNVPFTDYGRGQREEILRKIAREFPPEKFQELYQANPAPPTKEEVEEIKTIPSSVLEEIVQQKKHAEQQMFESIQIPASAFSDNSTYIPPEVMKEAVEKYNEEIKKEPKVIKRRLK